MLGISSSNDSGSINGTCAEFYALTVGNKNVRVMDVVFLLSAILNILYLIYELRKIVPKLRYTRYTVILYIFTLIIMSSFTLFLRAVLNISLSSSSNAYIILRTVLFFCFPMLTSLALVILLVGFTPNNQEQSRVNKCLVVSSAVSVGFTVIQAALDFGSDYASRTPSYNEFHSFSHNGLAFQSFTTLVFCICFMIAAISPWTRFKKLFQIPSYFGVNRLTLMVYLAFSVVSYGLMFLGGVIYQAGVVQGVCIMNVAYTVFLLLFVPITYLVFLRGHFNPQTGLFAFLYRPHLYNESSMYSLLGQHQATGLSINSGDILPPLKDNDVAKQSDAIMTSEKPTTSSLDLFTDGDEIDYYSGQLSELAFRSAKD